MSRAQYSKLGPGVRMCYMLHPWSPTMDLPRLAHRVRHRSQPRWGSMVLSSYRGRSRTDEGRDRRAGNQPAATEQTHTHTPLPPRHPEPDTRTLALISPGPPPPPPSHASHAAMPAQQRKAWSIHCAGKKETGPSNDAKMESPLRHLSESETGCSLAGWAPKFAQARSGWPGVPLVVVF